VVLYADQIFWHFNKDKTSADRNDHPLFSFTAVARLQPDLDRRSRDYRSMLSGMPADNEQQCALTAT
jgi:hypothetical protein